MRIVEAIDILVFDDLHSEALALMPSAFSVEEDVIEIDSVHGTLRGPRTQRHACGAQLQNWHEGMMQEWCEQQVSEKLFPTRCSYLYFSEDSILGLHQDSLSCTYTAVVNLAGLPPILRILLDEFMLTPSRILASSRKGGGFTDHGTEVPLHSNRLLLFRGSRYPHQLQRFTSPCTLAAFCYATLTPPTD